MTGVPGAPERIRLAEEEDRFSRFRLLGWWDQGRIEAAKVLVIGAGALGNEILKNLALLGAGRIFIADLDRIERSNLSRSVLFREGDEGRPKSEVAAARMREIHPAVRARAFHGDVLTGLGLGVYAWADVVIGGLDNREARLAANRACWLLGRPFVDGAIEALQGVARVFRGPEGPCYECTFGEADWDRVRERRSCALLGREAIPERHVPTTPTSASVIAGIQCQEALKHLHGMGTLRGEGFQFEGVAHESYRVAYTRREDCAAHEEFEALEPLVAGAAETRVEELLARVRERLGPRASVELPGDLVTAFRCAPCGTARRVLRRVDLLREKDALCEACGNPAAAEILSTLDGSEGLGRATLAEAGFPPFDIVRARSGERLLGLVLDADREAVLGPLAAAEGGKP